MYIVLFVRIISTLKLYHTLFLHNILVQDLIVFAIVFCAGSQFPVSLNRENYHFLRLETASMKVKLKK